MADIYKMVHEFAVKRQKEIEGAILGEVREIAKENGIRTEFILNEKAITQALLKSQKRKVIYDRENYAYCPVCRCSHALSLIGHFKASYCPECGQALDWEV